MVLALLGVANMIEMLNPYELPLFFVFEILTFSDFAIFENVNVAVAHVFEVWVHFGDSEMQNIMNSNGFP